MPLENDVTGRTCERAAVYHSIKQRRVPEVGAKIRIFKSLQSRGNVHRQIMTIFKVMNYSEAMNLV